MTDQVDFYLLQDSANQDRMAPQRLACRVAEKAFRLGLRIYVQVENEAQAQQFDDLLWTFSQGSFVPHGRYDDKTPESRQQPILIGTKKGPEWLDDLLISLTSDVVDNHHQYRRIADFIGNDEQQKAAGRVRFKHYRNLGLEPRTHDM